MLKMTSSVSQDILDEDLLLYIISLLFPCLLKNSVNKPIKEEEEEEVIRRTENECSTKVPTAATVCVFPMYFSYY